MGGGLSWWAGPRVASPGEKLARAAGPSREARGGAVHVLLEALHLADGAVADLGALVPLGWGRQARRAAGRRRRTPRRPSRRAGRGGRPRRGCSLATVVGEVTLEKTPFSFM